MATDRLSGAVGFGVERTGRSSVHALVAEDWRTLSLTPLVVLAAASVLLDGLTTYVVIVSPAFAEQNVVLAWLAGHHPLLAVGWLVANAGLFVLLAAVSLGWISTVAGVLTVCTNGLLAASNLVLFATGTALVTMAGFDVGVAVHFLSPLLGVGVGLLLEWTRYGLPFREALVVSTLYLLLEIGPITLL